MSAFDLQARLRKEFEEVKKGINPKVTSEVEAVVVLSGESGGSTPGIFLKDTEKRTNYGIGMYKKIKKMGANPVLVLNGTDSQNRLMQKMAKEAGVEKTKLIKNPDYPKASTDTQLAGVANLNFQKIAIITHAWHGVRVKINAEKILPKKMSFYLFLMDREKISKEDIDTEVEKIQKYLGS